MVGDICALDGHSRAGVGLLSFADSRDGAGATWLLDRKTQRVSGRTLAIICIGGFFFALDLAFYNTSILKTSAANATSSGITRQFLWA